MTNTFENPILSGFYPDPTICRVDDNYYLATSSFVYFPGIPIFHSKDLIHWEQIGHAIHRIGQLDYKNCETSLGLWAPSLHYHNGLFYLINTFVSECREARRDNYIVTAKNPTGPWSDPIFIEEADGIDSSLFFDTDNRMWYTGNYIHNDSEYEGHHGIYLCELNPITFQFIGNRSVIWDGAKTRSKWIEAPHLYKKNGYYYLMVAEGGTFTNHSVMMARSKIIDGDYEICPRNPIISHRHLSLTNPISVVGHGDIVETQNGEWWMVLLGIRPYSGFHFNLGRETFLVPVIWAEDGWLRIDNENGIVNQFERLPNLTNHVFPYIASTDHFEAKSLHFVWNTIHPPVELFYSLTKRNSYLRLCLTPNTISEITTPSFVGRRQQHKYFQATTALEFTPKSDSEEAGLAFIQDDRFNYIYVKGREHSNNYLRLYQTENGTLTLLYEEAIESKERIYLTVQATNEFYQFYYGFREHEYHNFYVPVTATLLSSNVNEGFTGCYLGMYATSNHTSSQNYADYDWFSYLGIK
ncbi:MAG: glycoside hydrolase family 43 protein [Lachnotalea sp.]